MEVVTNYEPYSQEPEYIAANKALVETMSLAPVRRVVAKESQRARAAGVDRRRDPHASIRDDR